jgi:hypothetical protein
LATINLRFLFAPMALALMGLPAQADIMYTLLDSGGNTAATITLKAIDGNTVQVTEDLSPAYVWAVTGAGESLEFNVDKPFTFVGPLSDGFTATGAATASSFGSFSASVDCTQEPLCGNGTSAKFAGELQFEIKNTSGLTPEDFISNRGGWYFASDIGAPTSSGRFSTGNLGTDTPGTTTRDLSSVPEPGSIILFGTLLAGVVTGLRKGRSRKELI